MLCDFELTAVESELDELISDTATLQYGYPFEQLANKQSLISIFINPYYIRYRISKSAPTYQWVAKQKWTKLGRLCWLLHG